MYFPGTHGERKNDVLSARNGRDSKHIGSGRISHSAFNNGQFCLWNRTFLVYVMDVYIVVIFVMGDQSY